MTTKKKSDETFVVYDQLKGTARIDHEKRVLNRIPVDRPVVLIADGLDHVPARIHNLSGSGALIEVLALIKKGSEIQLALDASKPPFAKATVTRIAEAGRLYGVAWTRFFEAHLPKGILASAKM